jgi:uncharacterized protein YdiU (UPF0061 family)
MPVSPTYEPAPSITTLGDGYYDEVTAARFPRLTLRFRNQRWAERVGLGALDETEWAAHFAGFEPLPGNLTKPLALRYHGHQFDVYNPGLGDGRGFLFAQLRDDAGRLLDLGTKGSGTTPWSRGGDGRLTLKGGVREVLATEMLEALGLNTSKSLSLFETGEPLQRGDEPSPTRSSVLVRLSHSHLRIGTFQRLAFDQDRARLERLVDYAIDHYFPALKGSPDRVSRFFAEVCRATIALCAGTMVCGFVHGVLNSDNATVTAESFDYGPYRFLPEYDPDFVAAYFDHGGLYSYGHQPRAFLRNLMRLGEALRPVEPQIAVGPLLADFGVRLEQEMSKRIVARLGLVSDPDLDAALAEAVFGFLAAKPIGFERFFFDLAGGLQREARALSGTAKENYAGAAWDELRRLLALYQPAAAELPAYFDRNEGPCTLLIDEIEALWSAIAERDDWAPFEKKIVAIRAMGAAQKALGA